ncbi:hypothetical protein TruAng_011119 [Truncatella angustata]|nr:hypothetical protein TruAng_011119 [Truncatella angustata]
MSPDSLDVIDRYFQLLAKLPGIVRHAYVLREANNRGLPVDIQKALLLADVANQVHASFLEWHPGLLELEPAPKQVQTKDQISIFPTVFQFENPWMGAVHMGYWASMVILQETLIQCRYPGDYPQREFAINILRSIENVGQGLMGAYRCGYSIRIAFEFVNERERDWLKTWLNRFEKNYAATSAKTYPNMEEPDKATG